MRAATDTDDPPARQPWEEPPRAGWCSSLPDLAKELGLFAGSAALGYGVVRLVHAARQLGTHEQHGFGLVILCAMWLGVCVLLASIGL